MNTLATIALGETVYVDDFQGNPLVIDRLQDMGFIPGSKVSLFSTLSGTMAVEVRGSKIAMRKEDASCVLIRHASSCD